MRRAVVRAARFDMQPTSRDLQHAMWQLLAIFPDSMHVTRDPPPPFPLSFTRPDIVWHPAKANTGMGMVVLYSMLATLLLLEVTAVAGQSAM